MVSTTTVNTASDTLIFGDVYLYRVEFSLSTVVFGRNGSPFPRGQGELLELEGFVYAQRRYLFSLLALSRAVFVVVHQFGCLLGVYLESQVFDIYYLGTYI